MTQANAVVETGSRLTILLGPVVAGVLIATIGAENVLYVDAATFAVSFLLLLLFVPNRPPLPQQAEPAASSRAFASCSPTSCSAR